MSFGFYSLKSKRFRITIIVFIAVTFLATSIIPNPRAQSTPPAWTDKQELPLPKADPAAAVYDGKLYVFGGYNLGPTDARRETYEYDPLTDSWTRKADMPTARWGAIAIEYEGRIYIFAGTSYSAGITSTEVYDPATDTWTVMDRPSPSGFNFGLMGARYGDKIHLFQLGMHYEYDPVVDTYTWKASMPTPRNFGTCAVVDGEIYVIGGQHYGGYSTGFIPHNENEAYDPASNTWAAKAPMPVNKWGSARGGSVINNRIYVTHGRNWTAYFLDNYVYDTSTDSWSQNSPPIHTRAGAAYGVIGDKLYSVGGVHALTGDPYLGLRYTEEYDPSIDSLPTVTVTVSGVSPPNSGTTDPAEGPHSAAENTLFSISATPFSGYVFDHWELDGVDVGSANPYSFNVSTSSHSIGAFFVAIPTVNITVNAVSPPNSGTTDPTVGQYPVPQNSILGIIATPFPGYVFDHWELDGVNVSSANPFSFNVTILDHTIWAFFTAIPTVTITVSDVSPLNSGTTDPVSDIYTITENSVFSIGATPFSGYVFDHWELDGVDVGSANPYSFNVGTSSHTISAFFTQLVSAQVDSCDSLDNWRPTGSDLSIDQDDFQEGNGALDIASTTTPLWYIYAILQKPMNLSQYSAIQIWIKPSDASRTLRLMVATDWGNYNLYTITGLTSNAWTLVSIDLSSPTSTRGAIDFNSISFFRFEYEVRRTSESFKIDDIRGIY